MKKSILIKFMPFILCFILCATTVGAYPTIETKAANNYTGEYWASDLKHAVEVKQLSANKVKIKFYMWYGSSYNEEGTDTYVVKLKNNKATFKINGTWRVTESFKCTVVFSKNTLKYKITNTMSPLNTGNKYLKLKRKYKKNFQDVTDTW